MWVPEEKVDPYARAKRLGVIAGILVLVGGFVQLASFVRSRPPPNVADRFSDVAPFVEFVDVGAEGWLGRLSDDWPGLTDPAALDAVCAELALRLQPSGEQSVSLTASEGTVRECAATGASRGPRRDQ